MATQSETRNLLSTWKECLSILAGLSSVLLLAQFWQYEVDKHVPDPYLDEVFHVPQAQVYCSGDYQSWDNKITTPPGLYVFSNVILKLGRKCSTHNLRSTNSLALLLLFIFGATCRNIIESIPFNSKTLAKSANFKFIPVSSYAIHTALNIALFPPIFFFSGLYYTDVLSTALVLMTCYAFLRRKAGHTASISRGIVVFICGILSLTMRQTNIFWVAIFMAGLELVSAVKTLSPSSPRTWKGDLHPYKHIQFQLEAYGRGEIHDVNLADATSYDYLMCVVSVAIAALFNPVLVVTRLWPYIAFLVSFAAFVVWNGGVVLGDKSNHTATLHLSQMLYIWPFFSFFSAPLVYSAALSILKSLYNFLTSNKATNVTPADPLEALKIQIKKESQSYIIPFLTLTSPLALILTIIHHNTIIHPFTLADNRHYMFYVFRYSILGHPSIKYLLGPIYLLCSHLVMNCLSGTQIASSSTTTTLKSPSKSGQEANTSPEINAPHPHPADSDNTTTSFALIWFLSTSLSLITAPLVEPRYFIIPWVIWRLHIPASIKGKYDYRLWLETFWFLGINAVTGYVFLFRGFEWVQEPGKVQRFMW